MIDRMVAIKPGLVHMIKNHIIFSKKLSKYKNIIHGSSTKYFGDLKVIKNRKKFFKSLGISLDKIIFMEQVHGTNIKIVTTKNRGAGTKNSPFSLKRTDAMMTNKKGIYLIISTADCLPLLAYNPIKKIVGAVHAGWRGTFNLIGEKLIKKMNEVFKSDPRDLVLYVGP